MTPLYFKTQLGKRIKKYRLMAGLTQQQLEKVSGVGSELVSCYEKGRSSPGLYSMFLIAQALGKTIDSFVEEEDLNG